MSLTSLLAEVRHLSQIFLEVRSSTGSYSDDDIAKMYAFRLLVHAELESLLEGWALDLNSAISQKNSTAILSVWYKNYLMTHTMLVEKYPPKSVEIPSGANPQRVINGHLIQHQKLVNENNGVSQKDIIKLFVPVGVSFDWLVNQRSWLRGMDNISRSRGEVAHSGRSLNTSTPPTPENERRQLVEPLLGLRVLRRKLDELHARI